MIDVAIQTANVCHPTKRPAEEVGEVESPKRAKSGREESDEHAGSTTSLAKEHPIVYNHLVHLLRATRTRYATSDKELPIVDDDDEGWAEAILRRSLEQQNNSPAVITGGHKNGFCVGGYSGFAEELAEVGKPDGHAAGTGNTASSDKEPLSFRAAANRR